MVVIKLGLFAVNNDWSEVIIIAIKHFRRRRGVPQMSHITSQ